MGESDEAEVKEGRDDAVLESSRLGEAVPEAVEVGRERRLEVGERGGANVVADDKEEEGLVLRAARGGSVGEREGRRNDARSDDLPLVLCCEEQGEVDFKDSLEEAHVGALVESDLVLPDVDDEDLGDGDGEESRLSLKVLRGNRSEKAIRCAREERTWSSPRSRPSVPSTSITSTLMSSPFDIQIPAHHSHQLQACALRTQSSYAPFVVCLLSVSFITSNLVPNSRLSRVPARESHQLLICMPGSSQRTLSGGLGAEDCHNIVGEALVEQIPGLHVRIEVLADVRTSRSGAHEKEGERRDARKLLVLVDWRRKQVSDEL